MRQLHTASAGACNIATCMHAERHLLLWGPMSSLHCFRSAHQTVSFQRFERENVSPSHLSRSFWLAPYASLQMEVAAVALRGSERAQPTSAKAALSLLACTQGMCPHPCSLQSLLHRSAISRMGLARNLLQQRQCAACARQPTDQEPMTAPQCCSREGSNGGGRAAQGAAAAGQAAQTALSNGLSASSSQAPRAADAAPMP